MDDGLTLRLLKILVEIGKIPKKYAEDEQIRQEFRQLQANGIPIEIAKQQLANDFCKGFDTIEDIIYRREKRYMESQ